MTIIEIESRPDGGHGLQSQSGRTSCWLEGWVEVPANLEDDVWSTVGYCDLQIEDGKLVGITPTERPEPEPEPVTPTPTELEQLRADVDYLSIMTGVDLV